MKTLEEELLTTRSRYHQDMLLLEWCFIAKGFGGGEGGHSGIAPPPL